MIKKRNHKKSSNKTMNININRRISIVVAFLVLCFSVIVVQAFSIQIKGKDFYTKQGDKRQIRDIEIFVPRGTIYDRNGEPLAISSPMVSIGINPSIMVDNLSDVEKLAEQLKLDSEDLKTQVINKKHKKFVYIKRRIPPYLAQDVRSLGLDGVEYRQEFKRFYPAGEIIAQLIGFTDANDDGKEGIERLYNGWLAGNKGKKQVIQDRIGNIIDDVREITPAKKGQDVELSIDRRLQYIAYKALKTAVFHHKASKGAAVILDVNTGEILAMVSQPSYNPNNITKKSIKGMRNRATEDVYEPGSVIKPFTVIAGMLSGKYNEQSIIDTTPGRLEVDGSTFRDARNYGEIDLSTLLAKSSNVGAAKIALNIDRSILWDTLNIFGFGKRTIEKMRFESTGSLPDYHSWSRTRRGNIAFGYGLQVTTLQLANAYATIANDGRKREPTYLKDDINDDKAIIDPSIAHSLRNMLMDVVSEHNTGHNAMIEGYKVAGKTGTARMSFNGGYADKYIASFVGFAPAMSPKIVVAVSITDPKGDSYGGGAVAAPVFKQIMQNSLRILNISPTESIAESDSVKENVNSEV
ncbi:MAG TPA: penicillin-binding protein 2, partial [Oceanospirillales bacterium]|nr:penicillin-binding protein 2 [Oceanospirillales bacterium]